MRYVGVQSMLYDSRVIDALRTGKPAVIKLIDPDAGWADAARDASPETTLVGRLHDLSHPQKLDVEHGIKLARTCKAKADETGIEIWEGSNEVVSSDMREYRQWINFEAGFAVEASNLGLKPLVGGHATGTTPVEGDANCEEKWKLFNDVLKDAWGMHWHEYWYAPEKTIINDGWNAYRYRKWWDFIEPAHRTSKWFLVSELGIEGHDPSIGAREGWIGHVSADNYFQHIKQYAEALTHFNPRIAATMYYAGNILDTTWQSYDVISFLRKFTDEWLADSVPAVWGKDAPKMEDKWQRSIDFVLKWEGGLSLTPQDRGNWTSGQIGVGELKGTNFGISAMSYPHLDIRNLTRDQAIDIYYKDYWTRSGAAGMDWPLCLAHFDAAVNSGIGRANRFLKLSDRQFGKYMAERRAWYQSLPQFDVFGRGWLRRLDDLLDCAGQSAPPAKDYTNQDVINVFYRKLGPALGLDINDIWPLIELMGLAWLVNDRNAHYSGAPLPALLEIELEK